MAGSEKNGQDKDSSEREQGKSDMETLLWWNWGTRNFGGEMRPEELNKSGDSLFTVATQDRTTLNGNITLYLIYTCML